MKFKISSWPIDTDEKTTYDIGDILFVWIYKINPWTGPKKVEYSADSETGDVVIKFYRKAKYIDDSGWIMDRDVNIILPLVDKNVLSKCYGLKHSRHKYAREERIVDLWMTMYAEDGVGGMILRPNDDYLEVHIQQKN